MKSNTHVREFLTYYCSLPKAPQYAVLLTGLWGSGKTWFIQDFLTSLPANGQPLYVSLYGVSTQAEIEADFFRQLHPILASKGVRLFSKLTKGILKTTINWDVDGDGKPDASITANSPTESLFKKSKIPEDRILIFDDLERCTISLPEVLGYINNFVEHGNFKVVLIANEQEFDKQGGYKRIKEKLIGRTFEILPDSGSALRHFMTDLPSEPVRKIIESNLDFVSEIYAASSYKNLRTLRHALFEFDRLCQGLDGKILKEPQLISTLLGTFLAYSFEIKSGNLSPDQISSVRNSMWHSASRKNDQSNEKHIFDKIRRKYSKLNLHEALVTDQTWEQIFATGSIPLISLNESLLKSRFFPKSNQPTWVRLWHLSQLSDENFSVLIKEVEIDWVNRKYLDLGTVLHLAGLFLKFSKAKLHNKSVKQVLTESRSYIGWLIENNHLHDNINDIIRNGNLGLEFTSKDDIEFVGLINYAVKKSEAAYVQSHPKIARDLLEMMKSDPDSFYENLIFSEKRSSKFYETPLLNHINASDFVNALLSLEGENQRTVFYMFQQRYSIINITSNLLPELAWLKRVAKLLNKEIKARKGRLSGHKIALLSESCIKTAISMLEEAKEEAKRVKAKDKTVKN